MRTLAVMALVVSTSAAPVARAQGVGDTQAADPALAAHEREEKRAQERADRAHEKAEREQERAGREEELYDRGTESLDEERWDRAVEAFDAVARLGGRRADAALYWKAYAQRKAGRSADALATLAELRKSAPQSRYLKEAD